MIALLGWMGSMDSAFAKPKYTAFQEVLQSD